MSDTQRGIAIIGCGGISRAHLGAIEQIDSLRVTAVCDIDEARAKEVQEASGAEHVLTDWRETVELAAVDIVDICTPHTLHTEPAVAAAEGGAALVRARPAAPRAETAPRSELRARESE